MDNIFRCSCGKRVQLRPEHLGKKLKCPGCGEIFSPQAPAEESSAKRIATPQPTRPDTSTESREPSRFDVFISYSIKDKATANALVARLEQSHLRCWIAPRDIVAGSNWSEGIISGIEECRCMVLVYSSHSNVSQQVVREVERAVGKGIPIIPFRIEAVPPSKAMEYFISSQHWLDAITPPIEKHFDVLVKTTKTLLNQGKATKRKGRSVSREREESSARPVRSRKWILALSGGLALLLVAAVAIGVYWPKKPADPVKLIEAQSSADVAWEQVKTIDPGDGLGERLKEIEVKYRSARALQEQKEGERALAAYQDVTLSCQEIIRLDKSRKSAKASLEKAKTAKSAAEAKKSATEAPSYWSRAEQSYREGEKALLAGDFEKAAASFQSAESAYTVASRAAVEGKAAEQARTAYLAELDGYDLADLEKSGGDAWKNVRALLTKAETADKSGEFKTVAELYQQALVLLPTATSIHKKLQAENTLEWDTLLLLEIREILEGESKVRVIDCAGEFERLKIDSTSKPTVELGLKGLSYERACVRYLKATAKDLILIPRKGAHLLITTQEHATALRKWDALQYARHKSIREKPIAKKLSTPIPGKVATWVTFPLKDCFDFLSDVGKVRLDIDWKELEKVEVFTGNPLITLSVDGMTIEQAIRACLEATSKEIGYLIEEDQVRISTWTELEKAK